MILVRGSGDVASAVAHRLFVDGHAVALHDDGEATASRRLMCFSDALYDGRAEIAGVAAVLTPVVDLAAALARRALLPIVSAPLVAVLEAAAWAVVVDARMRKRSTPEPQRHLAPLTIGLGPNFVAGETVHLAVETSYEDLGRVITEGPTIPLRGEPRAIGGVGRERYVYAPVGGRFDTERGIGEPVAAGEVIARIGALALCAPIAGAIRGLSRGGVMVAEGGKVIEIDPRGPSAVVGGIGERPRRIAEGVVEALRVANRTGP